MSTRKIIAIVVTVVMAAAAIGGLIVSGAPSQERARQFDARRLSDLQQISSAVDQYWTRTAALPAQLAELQNKREYYVPSLLDPRTQEPYEYRVTGAKAYEICATFETDSTNDPNVDKYPPPYYTAEGSNFWRHGVGRTCFTPEPTMVPGLSGAPEIRIP